MLPIRRYRDSGPGAFLVLTALAFGADTAVAGLKASAPKDVDLSGAWKVNLRLSEDPKEALEERRRQARERMDAARTVAGPAVGGIMGGVVGAVLGGIASRDPAQDERDTLQVLMQSGDQLEIDQQARALTRTLPGSGTDTCTTGARQPVTLSNGGAATRRCGWDGKAFVIELKLPNGFTRTERHQLAQDSNQLEITTDIRSPKGPRSSFRFKRVYDPVPALNP